MGEQPNAGRPAVAVPQAWQDGDDLVFHVGVPLPPICVFCGAAAIDAVPAIDTRGHPLAALEVLSARLPVCADDRRRRRRVLTRLNITVAVLFAVVLLTGRIPGAVGMFTSAMNPFGATLPGIGSVLLALAVFLGARALRKIARGDRPPPRRVNLRFDRSHDGYVWLHGADPRCLAQLPPAAPAQP